MTDAAPEPVLSMRGAAFRHPGGAGVSGLRFRVRPGEAVAVIGPNGAGKSTMLRGILGLVPLVEGEMRLGGRTDAADGMIGFLPQSADVDPDFPISLAQVVMQGRYRRLGLFRWPGRHDREVVRHALETVGLADLAHRRFGELSGGQRQRGLLARALASEPKLLLPTSRSTASTSPTATRSSRRCTPSRHRASRSSSRRTTSSSHAPSATRRS
jgi:zinc/manganese transport system ATP-binding protein